ncbi:uncharacterized protein Z520_06494 [Fonsecaea multimorphosa CBS 102226]|uniref:Glutamine amidotransferase domain-containing protein n=1 Tax=Fonsecaea multimorphosa CBS 102226 TaxID=1442371 RepID=A0A0D2IL25_9EURO|nr:uncharacterized protein Z520_06494 [Fonsecaea multimorphosa CBS 102226]KIX97716.1 hypothetical protein Z520_06494 [Fonsecaea multimorphosa CBS 102226]OAL23879.1 hypothetical protein AYO22_06055 [Fonsecaea multimorphosa]
MGSLPPSTETLTLHLAILICEVLPPPVSRLRGPFDQIFQTFFDRGAKRLSEGYSDEQWPGAEKQIKVRTTPYNATAGQLPDTEALEGLDALVVTGSSAGAYEDIEWVKNLGRFLQDTYKQHPKVKIFGTCFGHQIINQSLFSHTGGLHVMKNPRGWELGVYEITLNPKFASCFPRQLKSPARASPSRIQLQLSHQDTVVVTQSAQLPPECVEVGSTALCGMQGMYVPSRVLTLQAHPEFDREVNGACIREIVGADWPVEETREYLRMTDKDDDAALIEEVVMEFLLQGSKS